VAGHPRSTQRSLRISPLLAAICFGIVALAVVALVLIRATSSSSPGTTTTSASALASDAPKIAALATTVPQTTIDAVGAGTATKLNRITAPPLRAGGKPLVLYVGAEFCPYCAGERWAMVNALSRFGTFSGLGLTRSSMSDVFPGTPTFTFHGAHYKSKFLTFQGVEYASNVIDNGRYKLLDKLTRTQKQIVDTYDNPPYVSQAAANAIPFMDIGGRYVLAGAQYTPQSFNSSNYATIAKALHDASSTEAKAIIGGANRITADLCSLTGGKPASTCSDPAVKALAGQHAGGA
jgi:hypothetical protein